VQTLAAVGAQEGSVRLLVVPGLVGITRLHCRDLHCRDDLHQTGMMPTRRQDLGDDGLLADMALGDVLDRYPGGCLKRVIQIGTKDGYLGTDSTSREE
jgi:hypothetical protein